MPDKKRKRRKKAQTDAATGQGGPKEFDPKRQDEHPAHDKREIDPRQSREYEPSRRKKARPDGPKDKTPVQP